MAAVNTSVAPLKAPKSYSSLASNGLIVKVPVSVWTATVQDKDSARKVANDNDANVAAVKAMKNVLAGNAEHKAILTYRQTVYNWLTRRTYPWIGKDNYLPQPTLPVFMKEYAVHEDFFMNHLVEKFLQRYPSIVSDMAFKTTGMGKLFRRSDYPSVEELRERFTIRLFISEVPTNDYRSQCSVELAEELNVHYTREMDRRLAEIGAEQVDQLVEVMRSIAHCCDSDVKVVDGEQKITRRKIYDTTIQKALEYCETFATFNPTANAKLEQARLSLMATLGSLPSVEALKESDSLREQVKDDVGDILKRMGF